MILSAPTILAPWITFAEAEHHHVGAGFHLGREDHRADAGGHAAADVADLVEGRVFADLGQRDLRGDRVVAEGRGAHVVKDGLAVHAEAAGGVGHQALALRAADELAQVGLAAQAELALAALGRVERNDVVALLERGHAGADVDHDARAFVAEDGREDAFRVGAGERVVVGVADAGGLDLDQHLAELRSFEVDGFDGQRLAGLPGDGGFGFHGAGSLKRGGRSTATPELKTVPVARADPAARAGEPSISGMGLANAFARDALCSKTVHIDH
jgi:hypothetical protein